MIRTLIMSALMIGTLMPSVEAGPTMKAAPPVSDTPIIRVRAKLRVGGILKKVEARAPAADKILSDRRTKNIIVRYSPKGDNRGSWKTETHYPVRFNEKTRHYSGFHQLHLNLSVPMTDKEIEILIGARTEFGNYFWTRFTAKMKGSEKKGFSIAGKHFLDHYSETLGQDDPPRDAPPKLPPAPRLPPAETTGPPLSQLGRTREVGSSRVEHILPLAGISSGLLSQWRSDPIRKRLNNVRLYAKNEGERLWAVIRLKNFSGEDPTKMELDFSVEENKRLDFSRPVLIRVEIKSQKGNLYWTEEIRSADRLSEPLTITDYEGK